MWKICGIIVILSVGIMGCKSSSTSSGTVSKATKEGTAAYYLNIQDMEQRVAALMSGTFVCYRPSGNLMTVNAENDSIVTRVIRVGNAAKQGVWIYKESFISNLPDNPLVQLFQKIERYSPDSLILSEYRPKSKENSYKRLYDKSNKSFDENDLITTGCGGGIKKASQVSFEVYVELCERDRGDKVQWVEGFIVYEPQGFDLKANTYSNAVGGKENRISSSHIFYKRIPE